MEKSSVKNALFVLFATFSLFFSLQAQQPGNPDNWCREGLFTREAKNFGAGFVRSAKAAFYSDDNDSCPTSPKCKTPAFVVKGDAVITSRTFGSFTCGWFTSSKGRVTVGWLRTSDLEFPSMLHDASDRVWTGQWEYGPNSITVAPVGRNGYLSVKGIALWQGLGDNVHVGELDGRLRPKDGKLEYSDGDSEFDCRAKMELAIERYLIVADNGNCGGANVTFSGIYRKLSSTRGKK